MKRKIIYSAALLTMFVGLLSSCKESFLEVAPQAALGAESLANKPGVEAALIGAYAMLDGYHINDVNTWPADPVNWILGSVPSDDAYKGSEQGDNPEITQLELFQWSPGIAMLNDKYVPLYEGVTRTNAVLRLVEIAVGVEDIKDRVRGEALFLRAYYHFELYKVFGKVPYMKEDDVDFRKTNVGADPLADAIADLEAAVPLLPETQSDKGRVTRKAARAFLGKLYMYDLDFPKAIENLEPVVNSTALSPCQRDVFEYASENDPEALFSVQMSLSNAAQARNSNWLNQLAQPNISGGVTTCCGFHQPSQNLVNAFKVDANGLPLLDAFNDSPLDPAANAVDPRLDLTVGRDGVPYWDWAVHGPNFIRSISYSGPYSPKKFQPYNTSPLVAGGWNGKANNGVNVPIIRLADAILLLAEAEVEQGDLDRAEELVNMIRRRAAGCAQGPLDLGQGEAVVLNDINDASITWANYEVQPYPAGTFTAQGPAYARKAVRFERRLELALEGHRFFDLRRWDDMDPGYAASILNAFTADQERPYYGEAQPYTAKHRWFPLPTSQVQLSIVNGEPTLQQNEGW
ncbi:MAG TPA: RagB/SusD family nutrient uptake outer membrane protein [Ohtaekwangia sp.]|nr:RagB/SusD family nutrient uptake outer membrane protein [Ohtaekwangia sp.]